MSGEDDDNEEGGGSGLPSVADVLRLLRKRKFIILFSVALLGTGSLGFLSLLTPQYSAVATVFIDPRDHNIANMKQVTSDLIANTPSIESETEIIHSTEVAGRVIDELRLGEDPELLKPDSAFSKLKAMFRPLIGKPEMPAEARSITDLIEATAQKPASSDSVLEAFLGHVAAERVRETFLIQISYKSNDPEKAARIANAVAEAYVHDQVETKMRTAEQVTVWLERQIGELRNKVFAAERAVSEFKGQHQLYDSQGHPLDELEVTRQMEQLTLARNASAETHSKFLHAKQLLDANADIGTIGDVLKATAVVALKEQYADSLRQEAAAASKYGPLHPAMLKAKSQVESARAQLRGEVERIVTNLKSESEVAAGAQAQLEANLAKLKNNLNTNSGEAVRLRELEREATAAKEVYEAFLKRAQETTQQQDLQAPDAHIVNHATVPGAPISPKKVVIVAGGFGGGLGLGLVLAVLIELLFPSFVRSSAIEAKFKLQHLATVERFEGEPGVNGAPLSQLRRIVLDPHSVFSEQVRAIRVAIERQRKVRKPQIVLISSAVPGEGKSVLASNLALHCALSGVRTLLVDCDLSGRGLTAKLAPKASLTLYDCIMTRLPLRGAIVREAATGLHFLPALSEAGRTITPADLFASPTFTKALAALRSEFEIIVLDARAIVPSVEGRILAESADQIVFVHKWRETSQGLAQQALRALGHSLSKVTGVVVNQVDRDQLGNEAPLDPQQPRAPRTQRRREPRLAA